MNPQWIGGDWVALNLQHVASIEMCKAEEDRYEAWALMSSGQRVFVWATTERKEAAEFMRETLQRIAYPDAFEPLPRPDAAKDDEEETPCSKS